MFSDCNDAARVTASGSSRYSNSGVNGQVEWEEKLLEEILAFPFCLQLYFIDFWCFVFHKLCGSYHPGKKGNATLGSRYGREIQA